MSKAKAGQANLLAITLIKSLNKRLPKHKANAHGLGLRRMNQTVKLIDSPEVRGMINRISFLIKVEEAK